MYTVKELINDLESFNLWVETLQKIEDHFFFEPIAAGKWSVAEIISHITFWDEYILEEMLPVMKPDADIHSIEFEPLNQKAAKYALSGVSPQSLINRQLEMRKKVVSALKEKTEEEFFSAFTLNGEKIDEYSGYPHSMFNYFASFVWHDNHHKKQIEEFLSEKHVKV
ncbi:DinB family protein [Bacillus sp. FJAT-49711]|uniref:DinB family protein n=1 Tax=Bacillus sp. FJAT-49711 TaxID=2833585 RepID=UPI001BC8DC30|nr:DinB family protein [Bacillus sp. FJAT-49711]MBS4218264.1 DinB family protein [Bacillus sp. FJAT-49711]